MGGWTTESSGGWATHMHYTSESVRKLYSIKHLLSEKVLSTLLCIME